jgi:FkbM family methyltransferase
LVGLGLASVSFWFCRDVSEQPSTTNAETVTETQIATKTANTTTIETAWTGVDLSGKALYSQSREELVIRDYFRDRRGGVFLDVGAATPIRNSNTAYLEKHLEWSGIAVDALPEYADSWKKRRPRSTYLNYLVTDHAETVEPFYRSELPGISAVEKPLTGPAGNPRKFEKIQVPTNTLTNILDEHQIPKIDFLTIDIEGHEPAALRGFDIDRFQPELVCIEAKPDNREFIKSYFSEHGYLWLEKYLEYDASNYYFAKSGER